MALVAQFLKKIKGHNAVVPLVSIAFVGFSLMLLLISYSNGRFMKGLEQVISDAEMESRKMRLNSELMEVARSRTRLTSKIIDLEDPFEQDELNQTLEIYASRFTILRKDLLALDLNPYEQQQLDQHKDIVAVILPQQRRAVELAMSEDRASKLEAQKILYDVVLPGQEKLIRSFSDMVANEQNLISQLTEQSQSSIRQIIQQSYWIVGIGVSVIILISAIVIIRIRLIQKDLFASHNLLEQTVEQRTSELLRTQNMLQSVLDTIPVRVFWKDRNSHYLGGNRLFLKDARIDTSDLLVGKADNDMPWKHKANTYQQQDVEVMHSGEPLINQISSHTTPAGRIMWMETNHVPMIDEGGKCIGVLGIYNDITERKQAEDQLKSAMQAAEAANVAKSQFLANMSHEIRTPMNAVIGLSYLTLQTELEDTQRDYIEKVHGAAESLLGIINDILDFSKIEANKLDLEHNPFQLQDSLNTIKNMMVIRADEKGLHFEIKVDDDVPDHLIGDHVRLEQILINLINNAIKFTAEGEVNVKVQLLQNQNHQARISFIVSDTGIGLSQQQAMQLFKPFSQADASTTRQYGGTGLGLAICKQLCGLMQGFIEVSSEPGQGSDFSFNILLDIEDETTQSVDISEHSPLPTGMDQAMQQLAGCQLLLVEDNELNRDLALGLISGEDISIDVAENGQEALDLLQTSTYDAVLMDIQMPVMDGYEATRRIREQARFQDLIIIAMTANVMKEEIDKALSVGVNDFIGKPINIDLLFNTLLKWVPVKHKNRQLKADQADTKHQQKKSNNNLDIVNSINWEEFPHLDTQTALLRIKNDQSLYLHILSSYVSTQSRCAETILKALRDNDTVLAERVAHSAKGNAATIGAQEIYETADQVERAIRDGLELDEFLPKITLLEQQVKQVCDMIRQNI